MGKSIRDAMTSNPSNVEMSSNVVDAARLMKQEDVGSIPVVEGDRLVGIVTDRDIAIRVVAEGKDVQSVTVGEIASKDLVTVDPQQELDEALRLMAQHQVRRLPVVEEDGRLVGILAQADVANQGDDTKTGRMVEQISAPEGFEVVGFQDGPAALEAARRNSPALIIADYHLDNMTFSGFCKEINKLDNLSETFLVSLINPADRPDENHLRTLGVKAFLNKPFHSDELLDVIKSLREHRDGVSNGKGLKRRVWPPSGMSALVVFQSRGAFMPTTFTP